MNKNFRKDFKRHLELLGVKKKSNIVVYSNLSSFGIFSKKLPKIVLNTLLNTIGNKGSLIMPTYSLNVPTKYVFDVNRIVDMANISMLSKIFFNKKKIYRSLSPIHNHIGIGSKSKFLLKTNQNGSFGLNSDFHFMNKLNYKLILLGCTPLEGATYLHHLEALAGVPYRKWIKIKKKIREKNKIKTIYVDYYTNISKNKANFNEFFELIKNRKAKIKEAKLKLGSSLSINLKELHKHGLASLKENKFSFVKNRFI
jgi:aminoglycoside N3'-acetyltransferase